VGTPSESANWIWSGSVGLTKRLSNDPVLIQHAGRDRCRDVVLAIAQELEDFVDLFEPNSLDGVHPDIRAVPGVPQTASEAALPSLAPGNRLSSRPHSSSQAIQPNPKTNAELRSRTCVQFVDQAPKRVLDLGMSVVG
jgi:hypothetical protein